jgi:hypothetical protein
VYGSARVSTQVQELAPQFDVLRTAGAAKCNVLVDL